MDLYIQFPACSSNTRMLISTTHTKEISMYLRSGLQAAVINFSLLFSPFSWCKMYEIGFSETLVPFVKLHGVTSCKAIILISSLNPNRVLANQISYPCKSNRRPTDYSVLARNRYCDTKIYNGLFSYLFFFIKTHFC